MFGTDGGVGAGIFCPFLVFLTSELSQGLVFFLLFFFFFTRACWLHGFLWIGGNWGRGGGGGGLNLSNFETVSQRVDFRCFFALIQIPADP